jgi:ABC-2 type transport system ATP-binding protein
MESVMTSTARFTGVGRRFGTSWALAEIDLQLSTGVVGLLGPNGAGKTTLLRLLATALAPTRGQLSVFGLNPAIPEQRTGIRRRLGYLPQEVGFPRGFTAFAFVDYVAVLKEWTDAVRRHAEVRRVLDLVNLSDVSTKRIKTLSGGQRRRLALAQALIGGPDLLVLDEPTTGVDPEQRAALRTLLAEAARTSVVVLSTHQTDDVAALCERVIVLDGGRIHYDGPVRELVRQAAGKVWLADAADPAAYAAWRTGTGRYRNVADHAPHGVEVVEPSLEDAYLLLRAGQPATHAGGVTA